jgi:hypothetical protein
VIKPVVASNHSRRQVDKELREDVFTRDLHKIIGIALLALCHSALDEHNYGLELLSLICLFANARKPRERAASSSGMSVGGISGTHPRPSQSFLYLSPSFLEFFQEVKECKESKIRTPSGQIVVR